MAMTLLSATRATCLVADLKHTGAAEQLGKAAAGHAGALPGCLAGGARVSPRSWGYFWKVILRNMIGRKSWGYSWPIGKQLTSQHSIVNIGSEDPHNGENEAQPVAKNAHFFGTVAIH